MADHNEQLRRQQIGSMTAKGGFINEENICEKFLNFREDVDAQKWLRLMSYQPAMVKEMSAVQIPVRIARSRAKEFGVLDENFVETVRFKKADIQLKFLYDDVWHVENISLKKANSSAGFNQIDKRPVLTYQKIWGFDDDLAKWLRLFTGDILPKEILSETELSEIKDKKQRRLYLNEIPEEKFARIVQFFESNLNQVVSDIIGGRGELAADRFLVTRKTGEESVDWILKDIDVVCTFYAEGGVKMSPRGSLRIGRITVQRKGGTPDPTSLQFKINPLHLFED